LAQDLLNLLHTALEFSMSNRAISTVLGLGLLASLASNTYVPPERLWNNSDLQNGETFVLQPGETRSFILRAKAEEVRSYAGLLVELMATPGAVLEDSGLAAEESAGADSGADSGGVDSGADSGADAGEQNLPPLAEVLVVLSQGELLPIEASNVIGNSPKVLKVSTYDVFAGCVDPGPCETELELTVSVAGERAVEFYWGARLRSVEEWQPCDEKGEPEGCLESAPEPDVELTIE
jgi:hypothetical protein